MRGNRLAFRRCAGHLLICSIVVLAACSANAGFGPFKPTFVHRQLAPLTLPHVHCLATFSRLAPGGDPDIIYSLSTFLPTGQTDTRVLVTIGGAVYVTHLDGSGARQMYLPFPCYSPGVSADGSWLACPNETDQSHAAPELQIASLSPDSTIGAQVTLLAQGGFYLYSTWSPDGRKLAIVHDQENTSSGCAVGLYSSSPPYRYFMHLADVANSTHFEWGTGGCAIDELTSSPDGRWLAILSKPELFLVATSALFDTYATSPSPTTSTIDLPDTAFTTVVAKPSGADGSFWSAFSPSWAMPTSTLTYLSVSDGSSPHEEIVTYDPVRPRQQVLLRIPLESSTVSGWMDLSTIEHVDVIAWTPDGRQMLLVVNQSVGCVDCAVTYPSDVYLYTPSP